MKIFLNRGVDQLVDFQVHTLVVAGSSPAPATKFNPAQTHRFFFSFDDS